MNKEWSLWRLYDIKNREIFLLLFKKRQSSYKGILSFYIISNFSILMEAITGYYFIVGND